MDPSTHAATLSGMPFDLRGLVQNAQLLPMKPQQLVGDYDSSGQSRGARPQSFAERNIVVDLQFDRRQRSPTSAATVSAVCQIRFSSVEECSPHRVPTP